MQSAGIGFACTLMLAVVACSSPEPASHIDATTYPFGLVPATQSEQAWLKEFLATSKSVQGVPDDVNAQRIDRLGRENRLRMNFFPSEEARYYGCSTNLGATNCLMTLPNSSINYAENLVDWPRGLPRTCLALSGGGLRSATVSIGFLDSLARHRVLDKIDVISAVSGGTYALSWLLLRKINTELLHRRPVSFPDTLSDPVSTESLSRHARFIPDEYLGFAGLSGPITVPFGQPGSHHAYWTALWATFNEGSCGECAVKGDSPIVNLREAILLHQLPFPIFNATALTPQSGQCFPNTQSGQWIPNLDEDIFSITPLSQGVAALQTSGGLGLSITDAVVLSGAAIAKPDEWYCSIAESLNLTLGRWVNFLPSTTLFESSHRSEKEIELSLGNKVFLSDGGFAENLGIFPLIQRGCKTIIVLDAEHDPDLTFSSLERLSQSLDEQHSIKWTEPLRTRGEVEIDSNASIQASKSNLASMVYSGRFGTIPLYHEVYGPSEFALSLLELDVHYAKLGLTNTDIDCAEVEADWQVYFCTFGHPFPHFSTSVLKYTEEQHNALLSIGRSLGFELVAELRRRRN